jgi:predicted MFS family arabinose efflux permease
MEIGLLVACVLLVGAVLTLPMGSLVDRMNRRRLLLASVAVWTAGMVLSGTASSYIYMLISGSFWAP